MNTSSLSAEANSKPREPDVIDRMKQLLDCSIDTLENQTGHLKNALDRAIGMPDPTEASDPTVRLPRMVNSLNWMLGDLERACRDLANQVSRIREQKV